MEIKNRSWKEKKKEIKPIRHFVFQSSSHGISFPRSQARCQSRPGCSNRTSPQTSQSNHARSRACHPAGKTCLSAGVPCRWCTRNALDASSILLLFFIFKERKRCLRINESLLEITEILSISSNIQRFLSWFGFNSEKKKELSKWKRKEVRKPWISHLSKLSDHFAWSDWFITSPTDQSPQLTEMSFTICVLFILIVRVELGKRDLTSLGKKKEDGF